LPLGPLSLPALLLPLVLRLPLARQVGKPPLTLQRPTTLQSSERTAVCFSLSAPPLKRDAKLRQPGSHTKAIEIKQ
jgi:hypothetical protein